MAGVALPDRLRVRRHGRRRAATPRRRARAEGGCQATAAVRARREGFGCTRRGGPPHPVTLRASPPPRWQSVLPLLLGRLPFHVVVDQMKLKLQWLEQVRRRGWRARSPVRRCAHARLLRMCARPRASHRLQDRAAFRRHKRHEIRLRMGTQGIVRRAAGVWVGDLRGQVRRLLGRCARPRMAARMQPYACAASRSVADVANSRAGLAMEPR